MTVNELIEELKKYPGEMRVAAEIVGFGDYSDLHIRKGKAFSYKTFLYSEAEEDLPEIDILFLGYDSY